MAEDGQGKDTMTTAGTGSSPTVEPQPLAENTFSTLLSIKSRVLELASKLPLLTPRPPVESQEEEMHRARDYAEKMKSSLEEFDALVGCVGPATYRWNSDRSGRAQQGLGTLCDELYACQNNFGSATARLDALIHPVVDVVRLSASIKTDTDGSQSKIYQYGPAPVDPESTIRSARTVLRTAHVSRQVVLLNYKKAAKVMEDYIESDKNDESGRGMGSLAY